MSANGRRLLFFFDGSSNIAAGRRDVVVTNVTRLNQLVTYGFSGIPQIAFYFAGVGTRGDAFSAITGRGFDEIVMEAYVNLASNYMDGDEIYLFGFSRGAAAAQVLSELISECGLLSIDQISSFPDVWKFFVDSSLEPAARYTIEDRLGNVVFMRPSITFLGLFDTVAGSSWDRIRLFTKMRTQRKTLSSSVGIAVQLLSIDDRRLPSFKPSLWIGDSGNRQIEQIWMPGVHGDVGGNSNGRFLCDMSLLTMIDRIEFYCPQLELDEGRVERLSRHLFECREIQVTEEIVGASRLLPRGRRAIEPSSGVHRHPVFDVLLNQSFKIRGERRKYEPKNMDDPPPELKLSRFSNMIEAAKPLLWLVRVSLPLAAYGSSSYP